MPVEKYTDPISGVTEEYDSDSGKLLRKYKSLTNQVKELAKPSKSTLIQPEATVAPNSPQRQEMKKAITGLSILGETLPVGLSLAGDFAVGPLGGAIGGGVGSALQQSLMRIDPRNFGQPAQTPIDTGAQIAFDAVLNPALNTITRGLSNIGTGNLRKGLVRRFGKEVKDPEFASFLAANSDFPITTGQATESPVANILEQVFNPFKSTRIRQQQQQNFISHIPKAASPSRIAQDVQKNLNSGFTEITDSVNAQFTNLRRIAGLNLARTTAGGKVTTVSGPIQFTKSADFAENLLKSLEATLDVQGSEGLKQAVSENLKPAIIALQRIAKTKDTVLNRFNPVDIDAALQIKRITGEMGFSKSFLDLKLDDRLMRNLNRLIDEDIRDSIGKFTNGADIALRHYDIGNKLVTHRANLFKETAPIRAMLEETLSGVPDVQQILKDPVAIRRTIAASGGKAKETRALLQSEFLEDIMNQATQKGRKTLKHEIPFQSLTDRFRNESAEALFAPDHLASIQNFFKAIQKLDPNVSKSGNIALGIRTAGAGLTLASGLVPLALGEDASTSAQTAGTVLGAVLTTSLLSNKILMNPKVVRAALGLTRVSPSSTVAKQLRTTLFLALRGATIPLTAPDGTIVGSGVVNDEGKVVPDKF